MVYSSASAFLNNIIFSAALPVAVIIAVGVASPKAHGQAITSTLIKIFNDNSKSFEVIYHINEEITAIIITAVTKTPATLSAIFAIGALLPEASSTILIICEREVSKPTFSAVYDAVPFKLTVPANMLSPFVFSTGRLSPVSIDSSAVVCPSKILPSQQNLSPGLIRIVSPILISSTETVFSPSGVIKTAVLGESLFSFFTASPVLFLEFASRYFPSITSAIIIAVLSK